MYKRFLALFTAVLALIMMCGCDLSELQSLLQTVPDDGLYTIEVTMEGGTEDESVKSPTMFEVMNGRMSARITWSSSDYDYMIVDGEKIYSETEYHKSVFDMPVSALNKKLTVTVYNSDRKPHEAEYTFYFDSKTVKPYN